MLTAAMGENLSGALVFDACSIGRRFKPLTRHGWVIVRPDSTITLLGTKGDLIDAATLSATTTRRVLIRRRQSVRLVLEGRTYNVRPGWGSRARRSSSATDLTALNALLGAVGPRAA